MEGTVVTARRQGAIEIWSSDHPARSPVQLGVASDVGETNCIINLCDGRVVSVGAAVIMWDVASKSSVAHVQLLDGQGDIYKVFFFHCVQLISFRSSPAAAGAQRRRTRRLSVWDFLPPATWMAACGSGAAAATEWIA